MPYQLTVFLCFALFAVVSYLLGSINFAIITTKLFTGNDVRDSGSGNAGMTNVMRTAGFLPGVITFGGDFLKAIIACALGKYALTPLITALVPEIATTEIGLFSVTPLTPFIGGSIAGLFCIIGHIFPLFFGFRGGKGIVTAAGTMIILDPRIFAIEVTVFLIFFLCSRIISLGSIIAAGCYPLVSFFCFEVLPPLGALNLAACTMENPPAPVSLVVALGALVPAVVVIIKHKDNIKRLLNHEEKKLTLKKKEQ